MGHVRDFFCRGRGLFRLARFVSLVVLEPVDLETNAMTGFLLAVAGLVVRALRNLLEVDRGGTVVRKILEVFSVLALEVKLGVVELGILVVFGCRGGRVNGVHAVHVVHVLAEVREALGDFLLCGFVSHKF